MSPRTVITGFGSLGFILSSQQAHAAEGVAKFVNFYEMILHAGHLDHMWQPTVGALLVLVVIVLMGLYFKKSVESTADDVVPDGEFSLRFVIEGILEAAHGLTKDNCGKDYERFLPLLTGTFLFILVANLSGLVPGLPPPTETMDMNVAMGVVAFIAYNFAGIKEHRWGYLKHFFGPVAFIAPLFFCIELVSHASRPLSLGLRLTGNIFGDHLLLGVFTGLTYFIVPSLLLFFGLMVSVVQSFVFTLLTGLYISMAISHDH